MADKTAMTTEGEQQEAVCGHTEFNARVDITRLTSGDGAVSGYTADVVVRCAKCNEPFDFVGLPMGSAPTRPMVSFDGIEARLPLRPHFDGIPAPVVPSDDEARFRCAGCGVRLRDADLISTSGKGGRRDAHLITGSVPDYCGPVNDVAPAPPTPSQDAEGDGWRKKREDGEFGVWADFYQGRPISPFYVVPYGVESAIHEPYEELVKAADEANEAFWGMFGVTGLPSPILSKMRALDAALTRIEESHQ